jgi:asparagine synthase (glutamine-hydrolysing)
MSGIVGLWNLDGQPVSSTLLNALSGPLAHRGPDAYGQWLRDSIGLACHLMRITPESAAETQPAIHPSGPVLVFDGRLDNRDELLAQLKDARGITRQSPDTALILAIYDIHGERFIEHLAGDFALALYDPRRKTLLLARDVLGIRPLYHTRVGNCFLFASEIKALLAHPKMTARPNDDMLACYIASSRPKDVSMTCFQGIVSLPPAHVAVIRPEGTSTRQYWDFSVTAQRFDSIQEYAGAFRHYLTQAVQRRLRSTPPVVVSISGGLDSSSILCLAERERRARPQTAPSLVGLSFLSPEGSPSDEKEFLVHIEHMYGLSIQRMPTAPGGIMTACQEALWHIEAPFLDQQWNTTHAFFQTARQLGARVILTGHWADQVLFPQGYLVDLFRRLAWRDIHSHLSEFGRWMTEADPRFFRQRFWLDLIKHHVPARLFPLLRRLRTTPPPAWYADSFRRRALRHVPSQPVLGTHLPTVHARSLYEEVRSSFQTRCMEWDNKVAAMHGCDIAFPFLDRDLIMFLMGIPGEIQTWKGVPKGLLREAMRGILPDAITDRTWKANFSHLVNDGMRQDYPQLVNCLGAESAAVRRGYLDRTTTDSLLQSYRQQLKNQTSEAAWALSDLLGLELWLQVFFEQNTGLQQPPVPDTPAYTSVS